MGLMDGSGNYSAGLENYPGHTELSNEFSKFSMVGGERRRKRIDSYNIPHELDVADSLNGLHVIFGLRSH